MANEQAAPELDFFGGLDPNLVAAQSLSQRKRKALELALLNAAKERVPTYARSPLAVGLDYLAGSSAKKKLEDLDKTDAADLLRYTTAERGELGKLFSGFQDKQVELQGPMPDGQSPLTGNQPADPRAAITRAMSSPFPSVQKMGGALWKQRGDTFNHTLTATQDMADVPSILRAANSQDVTQLLPKAPIAPQPMSMPVPGGGPPLVGVQTTNAKGASDFKFPPAGQTINNNLVNKPVEMALTEAAKYYVPGGKGYDKNQDMLAQLSTTQELLSTLAQSPEMGAGGEAFQVLRKWAQTLGANINEKTTPTEIASMQLGRKVLERLGGLGNQISDKDRDFMLAVQGSLGTDPTAARRMLMLEAKYMMKAIAKEAGVVDAYKDKLPGLPLVSPTFNFQVPDAMGNEFGSLMETGGFPNTPALPPGVRALPRQR